MAVIFATATLKDMLLYGGSSSRSRIGGPLPGVSEYIESGNYNDGFWTPFDDTHDELYMALDMSHSSPFSTGSPRMFKIMNQAGSREILRIQGQAEGIVRMQIYNGAGYTNLGDIPLPSGRKRYDMYFKRDTTVGRIVIKINGDIIFDYTGNTDLAGTPWGGIAFGSTRLGDYFYFIIIADENTEGWTLLQLNYTANGDTMEWTGSVGNINGLSAQNSVITSMDSTFIETSEVDKDALFNIAAVPSYFDESKIRAMVVTARASADAPINHLQGLARIGGVTYAQDATRDVKGTLQGTQTVFDVNPATGLPWTPDDLASTQFGYRSKG